MSLTYRGPLLNSNIDIVSQMSFQWLATEHGIFFMGVKPGRRIHQCPAFDAHGSREIIDGINFPMGNAIRREECPRL